MKIKTGDTVVVITGEYKGEKGRVIECYPKQNKVLIEGINMVSRHQKPSAKVQQGGIFQKEAPIHVSNVMLWDDKEKSGTRVKIDRSNGDAERISVKSGNVIAEPKWERGRRK